MGLALNKPQEISRRVVTYPGYTTGIDLPELVKGIQTTIRVSHEGNHGIYQTIQPVVTTVWITQEKEQ